MFNVSLVQRIFDADAGPRMNSYSADMGGGNARGRGNTRRYPAVLR